MVFDSLTLAACLGEIRSRAVGLTVHQVRQPEPLSLVIVFRGPGVQVEVFLSADARYARIHLNTRRLKNPPTPPQFCQLLRKHLEGKRCTSIDQIGVDRIYRMTFESFDAQRVELVHEIMGRHSNIILCDDSDKVLGAIKLIGARQSRIRHIYPGITYSLPPVHGKPFLDAQKGDLEALLDSVDLTDKTSVASRLTKAFTGLSPVLADEIVARADNYLSPDKLLEIIKDLTGDFLALRFHPVLVRDPERHTEFAYPVRLVHLPEKWQHPRESGISESLESTVLLEISLQKRESLRADLHAGINRTQKRLQRELDEVQKALSDDNPGAKERKYAELLSASFHLLKDAKDSVSVPDYYDPQSAPIAIPLKGDLNPQQNVQRYFKLARKAEERYLYATDRLPELLEQQELLSKAVSEVEAAQDIASLETLKAHYIKQQLIAPAQHHSEVAGGVRPFDGHRIKTRLSTEGIEILVGETADANDYLTTKVAKPDDIWLHARSVSGAHVIVRAAGLKQVPPKTLNEAAQIAAENSDAKHSSYVAVDWTRKKFVRKPRKSTAGFVTYTNEKTIHITRS